MKLIDNIKKWPKYWSVRLSAIGASLLYLTLLMPDVIFKSWAVLPDDIKAMLPTNWTQYIALILWGLAITASAIKQTKLHKDDPDA